MIWTCISCVHIVNQYAMQEVVFKSNNYSDSITMIIDVSPETQYVVGQEYEFPTVKEIGTI